MFDTIRKLQKKSNEDKKSIARIAAGTITGSIFIVWLSVVTINAGTVTVKGKEISETQTATPFSALKNDIAHSWSSLSKQVEKISSIGDVFTEEVLLEDAESIPEPLREIAPEDSLEETNTPLIPEEKTPEIDTPYDTILVPSEGEETLPEGVGRLSQ